MSSSRQVVAVAGDLWEMTKPGFSISMLAAKTNFAVMLQASARTVG